MAIEDDPCLRPGQLILIGRAASVQFGPHPILARVIRTMTVETERTYTGWCWLEVFQLDSDTGQAVSVREVFVQPHGIVLVGEAPASPVLQPNVFIPGFIL